MKAAEFLAALEPRGECLVWPFAKAWNGYGLVKIDGAQRRAHRLAWELANGPIPDGMWVLHHCDNPPCCNPAHLYIGTHQDNVDDKVARGRTWLADRPHSNSRLSPAQVLEMRTLRAGGVRNCEIAARFGVSKATASRACTGAAHRHADEHERARVA